MKAQLASILLLLAAFVHGSNAWDLKTRNERIFRDCALLSITETGLHITCSEGIASIEFRDLPSDIQQQIHFDAEKGKTDYKAAANESYQWYLSAQREAARQDSERQAVDQAKRAEDSRARAEADLVRREQNLARREQDLQRGELELQKRAAALAEQERNVGQWIEFIKKLQELQAVQNQQGLNDTRQMVEELKALKELKNLR